MSLFSDTADQVYTLTNRSDLTAETSLAVRQATLGAHHSDKYLRDLFELQVAVTPAAVFSLDIPTYFPQYRQFKYIRPYDLVTGSFASFFLEFLAPDAIFDEYLIEKVNVAYVAGTNLNMKLQGDYGGFVVGYYKNPILSPDGSYNSWIAQDFAHIIVMEASIRIFTMIGYEEAAGRMRRLLYEPGADGAPSEFNRFRAAALEEIGR